MMETISETDFALSQTGDIFSPTMFVDITGFIKKMKLWVIIQAK